jgi:hypothetical protein
LAAADFGVPALSSLQGDPNLFPGNGEQFRLAPNGMVDQSSSPLPWFLEMVAKRNEINGHTIIAADLFARPPRRALSVQRASKSIGTFQETQVLLAYYLLNRLHHREFVILLLITEVFQLAQICFEGL